VTLQPDGVGPSDHTSFYMRDIPVLHFFTNTHADYHKPSDDWDRVDADGLERVAQLVAALASEVAAAGGDLTLQRGAGQPGRAPTRGSGAWLGTVPDFSPVERGVLLGGVTAESPGARAGMRKGDILIRLGVHEIRDLQEFTDALAAHEPGDTVAIVVIRDGREVHLEAVLGRRGS
jgi:S1-C subfamily serine protease